MQDTSPAGQKRYNDLLRRLTPAERVETVVRLNRTIRELAMAGIDVAHPNASPEERRALLAERLYGKDVAQRLYGGVLDELRRR